MKTPPPPSPTPESGPQYWRSLEQLADTPEFRQWVEREFPEGASEFFDPVTRRHFVRIMSASFLLAGVGLTGCRRPVERIYPFAKMPEDFIHGVPQFYATAMPSRRSAVPLVVKSSDGRPTKIEGNPDHPDSNGGTDAMAQASVLSLYDPDRSMKYGENGTLRTKQQALDYLASVSKKLGDGTGLAFLMEQSSSPSRARLQKELAQKHPNAKWHVYEPVDFDTQRKAASLAYGTAVQPYYCLDQAQAIVALDCDFIGAEENAHGNIRRFAKGRHLSGPNDSMSRLYAVESLFTLTGANADHRLRVAPSLIVPITARLAMNILPANDVSEKLRALAEPAKGHDDWIVPCATDLKAKQGKSLVMAGHRLPLEAHLLVVAMNEALGATGQTVKYHSSSDAGEGTISELATALNAGQVETLVELGGNPVYNAPDDLNWAQTQAKAKTLIRLAYDDDESLYNAASHAGTHWDLPRTHYLESWGDGRTADGTLVPIQPLIDPLFNGLTDLEVLATLGGLAATSAYEIVRETFRGIAGSDDNTWAKYLHDGFLAGSAAPPASAQYNSGALSQALAEAPTPKPAPSAGAFDVVFHRDYKVDDGRHNNNGWLQELPDPITKLTWDNAILVSPATAKEFGLIEEHRNQNQQFADKVVEVVLNGRNVRGAVWVQPGMADYTVGLALGYGRERTGRIGRGAGYNAYRLRTTGAMHYALGATLVATSETYQLSTTQSHWGMEGRPVVREANFEQYRKQPNFANHMEEKAPVVAPMYPNPLDVAKPNALHQWGMSIDLNRCVGCSACMTACQSENNIPIVGKQMVGKSREMHWIRLDRYYTGPVEDPQAVTQPMLCQHCEAAPCESVCPVNATTHDEEGLNLMVYNRCVGTRYCSNNCPYKVRRFNFFDYNRRPLTRLYTSPLVSATDGEWEMKRWWEDPDRGSRPEDEWQLIKLVKNPDVSVRMRGVMEKCSYCLQRIEQAKIAQKVKARNSNHIRLLEKEGTVPKTACQQACPAEAIVFGDVSDPESTVTNRKHQERNYKVLEFLLTKPRTTYLAKVRNPNPEMPDTKAHDKPYSTEEFYKTMGKPEEDSDAEMTEKGKS